MDSKYTRTRLFFDAVRGTARFSSLMESVGDARSAGLAANTLFTVENGNAGTLINELLNRRVIVESYTPPAFSILQDLNIPTIRTANGGEYVCHTANPSVASELHCLCESVLEQLALLEAVRRDMDMAEEMIGGPIAKNIYDTLSEVTARGKPADTVAKKLYDDIANISSFTTSIYDGEPLKEIDRELDYDVLERIANSIILRWDKGELKTPRDVQTTIRRLLSGDDFGDKKDTVSSDSLAWRFGSNKDEIDPPTEEELAADERDAFDGGGTADADAANMGDAEEGDIDGGEEEAGAIDSPELGRERLYVKTATGYEPVGDIRTVSQDTPLYRKTRGGEYLPAVFDDEADAGVAALKQYGIRIPAKAGNDAVAAIGRWAVSASKNGVNPLVATSVISDAADMVSSGVSAEDAIIDAADVFIRKNGGAMRDETIKLAKLGFAALKEPAPQETDDIEARKQKAVEQYAKTQESKSDTLMSDELGAIATKGKKKSGLDLRLADDAEMDREGLKTDRYTQLDGNTRHLITYDQWLTKSGKIIEKSQVKPGDPIVGPLPYKGRIGKNIYRFETASSENARSMAAINASAQLMSAIDSMRRIARHNHSKPEEQIEALEGKTKILGGHLERYLSNGMMNYALESELTVNGKPLVGSGFMPLIERVAEICRKVESGEPVDIKELWMLKK